jgi:hypothetical protein
MAAVDGVDTGEQLRGPPLSLRATVIEQPLQVASIPRLVALKYDFDVALCHRSSSITGHCAFAQPALLLPSG